MVVLQQRNDLSFQVNLHVLQIVVGTPVQTSTCNVVVSMPIAYEVVLQAVFLNKSVAPGMAEEGDTRFVEEVSVVVYDHNVALKDFVLVGMDSHRVHEQAISMLYHGDHPIRTIVVHKADRIYRIEEVHFMPSIGETMALQAGKIAEVPKMQKHVIFVHD